MSTKVETHHVDSYLRKNYSTDIEDIQDISLLMEAIYEVTPEVIDGAKIENLVEEYELTDTSPKDFSRKKFDEYFSEDLRNNFGLVVKNRWINTTTQIIKDESNSW